VSKSDLEEFELKLNDLIHEAHKSGVNYWEVLRIFLNICQHLQMQADAEYYAKQKE